MDVPVRLRVATCSRYVETGALTRWDMDKIAWIIEKDPQNQIGFLRPGSREHLKAIGGSID
jgi:hypothetical protein